MKAPVFDWPETAVQVLRIADVAGPALGTGVKFVAHGQFSDAPFSAETEALIYREIRMEGFRFGPGIVDSHPSGMRVCWKRLRYCGDATSST